MSTQDRGRDAGPAERHAPVPLIRQGPLLTFLALALAVVVTATVARWPAHAADLSPDDAALWNPGQVTYQYDNSGCHTIQQASIDTTSPDMASMVSEVLDKNKTKDDFGKDAGVKMLKINDIREERRPHRPDDRRVAVERRMQAERPGAAGVLPLRH